MVQYLGLGSAGITIQNHYPWDDRRVVDLFHHQRTKAFVAPRQSLHPPADLRQNAGK